MVYSGNPDAFNLSRTAIAWQDKGKLVYPDGKPVEFVPGLDMLRWGLGVWRLSLLRTALVAT